MAVRSETACAARLLLPLLLATLPLLAQTAVTPPGSGTAASPYRISQLSHLVWMGDTVAASAGTSYALQNDIDAAATATWNDVGTDATLLEGFRPIGQTEETAFMGDFDGQGHVIRGLTINRPEWAAVGLFGRIGSGGVGGAVRHLGLEGGAVTGDVDVGGLTGVNDGAELTQCYVTGPVTARAGQAGGLVGVNTNWGTLTECYASAPVAGLGNVGGLVGFNNGGTLARCYAAGTVTGQGTTVGGLVGFTDSTITDCYALGAVTGLTKVGGLLGSTLTCRVTRCYAVGAVTG
jgi:hypothetical protein